MTRTPLPSKQPISEQMFNHIKGLSGGLQNYSVSDLVKHAEQFGKELKLEGLKTNQIRKFLDAVTRLKIEIAQSEIDDKQKKFSTIASDIILLKPKLAYAGARQRAVKPLSKVMTAAIDKISSPEDFIRLAQLIESIIAYHKAEGGE